MTNVKYFPVEITDIKWADKLSREQQVLQREWI